MFFGLLTSSKKDVYNLQRIQKGIDRDNYNFALCILYSDLSQIITDEQICQILSDLSLSETRLILNNDKLMIIKDHKVEIILI